MRKQLAVVALTLIVAVNAAASVSGRWMANAITMPDKGELQLNLMDDTQGGMQGFHLPLTSLTGIDDKTIASPNGAAVSFQLRAEAGTISFEGVFASGSGTGKYSFAPNEAFETEMGNLGYGAFSERKLFVFTFARLTAGMIRELQSMGLKPSRKELEEVALFRITPAYAREIMDAGVKDISVHDLVQLRIGRIDGAKIHEYEALGYKNISASRLAELGIMRVTPQFIRDMAELGYSDLPLSKLVQLRTMNVTPEYIRSLQGKK